MANLVITHFSGIFFNGTYQSSCYYDGMISALLEEGHNVLQIITSNFLSHPWNGSNRPYSEFKRQRVLKEVVAFKPDLIISFNNSSIEGIEDALDCPIALWDADSFRFFNDKKKLLKNQDRYCYFAFSSTGLDDYDKEIDSKAAIKARVPSATHVRHLDTEKRYNISFIGNAFFNSDTLQLFLKDHPEFVDLAEDEISKISDFKTSIAGKRGIRKTELLFQSSGLGRANVVFNLFDYDIKIFGDQEWYNIGSLDSRVFKAYDPSKVYSLAHNELIYNRSKISLNVSHKQNITGYPWRVLDIMASSSALITDSKPDFIRDFPGIKAPIYNSISDLLRLTSNLLEDEAWRKEYVFQCNNAVDEGFRWKHRFALISQITGVDMSPRDEEGLYQQVNGSELTTLDRFAIFILAQSQPASKIRKIGLKNRIRKTLLKYMPDSLRVSLIKAHFFNASKGKKAYE